MISNPHRDELPEAIKQAIQEQNSDEAACIAAMFDTSFMMTKKDISDVLKEAGVSAADWNELLGKYVPKHKKKDVPAEEEEEIEFDDGIKEETIKEDPIEEEENAEETVQESK